MPADEQLKKFRKEIIQRDLEIKKLKSLVAKDSLTGLYNRRGFLEESEKILSSIASVGSGVVERKHVLIDSFSVMLFDIDHFKNFNDQYGHKLGDQVLQYVANLIVSKVRSLDVAARWGGEEFVVGLVGAGKKDAYRKAEEIRKAVSSRIWLKGGKKIKVTLSGGVADIDDVGKNPNAEELVACADKVMYQAKQEGRDKVVMYKRK